MADATADVVNITFRSLMAGTSFLNGSDMKLCPPKEEQKDTYYQEFFETAQTITGLFVYPTAVFFGLVGNALTIFVLSSRNMHTSTNAFLSALALSDSIKLINDLLYFMVIVFMRISSHLGELAYGYLYPYAHFVFAMSMCVSSWLTVSVAVERYILVCHPTKAKAMWNRRRAVILCTFIYIIMTSLALPTALRYRTIRCVDPLTNTSRLEVELTEIWQNEKFVTVYDSAQNMVRSIIPLLLLVVLNACIISALRRTKAKKRKNSRHRVTIMMLVVILVFLLCITPDAIMSMVFGFGYHEAGYLGKGFREITDSLLTINAGVNFIIYCACNQVFRKNFARLCFPKKRHTHWMTELDESTYRRYSESKSLLSCNNNSSPRQDTPTTAVTDSSANRGNKTADNNTTNEAVNKWMKESNPEHNRQSMSSTTSVSSAADSHNSHQQHHQNQRVSSSGLKKCRNSIKTNRAKKKSSVTFRDNTEAGKLKFNLKDDSTTLDSEKTSSTDPSHIKYNHHLDRDNSSQFGDNSMHISSDMSTNQTYVFDPAQNEDLEADSCDTQQLAKFRNCDGSNILSNSNHDSNINPPSTEDDEDQICVKDGSKSTKKMCNFSSLFQNPVETGGESRFLAGEETICDSCRVSYSKGHKCVHVASDGRGCNYVKVASTDDPTNNESTRDLDYPRTSISNGVVLTTDL